MGRHSGWIALEAGMAGNANAIVIPEFEYPLDELCELLKKRHKGKRTYSIVVVAEGVIFPEMKEKVEKVLDEIRPMLIRDGGNVELVSIDDGVVKVRLQGACAGCPMSQMTLRNGIERVLKEKVPEVVAVEPA